MQITELLDQYKRFAKAALSFAGGAKLNKSIRNNIIEILLLFMVIPRKINFLQLERYATCGEQTYRHTFEREPDWMEMNLWLSAYTFKQGSRRMVIAIHPLLYSEGR